MSGPNRAVDSGASVGVVAAADGRYSSRVPLNAQFVTVSAVTTDANDWIILPPGVDPGHEVMGWSQVAHEMRTEASSGIKINDVDSDGSAEAAIPATTLWSAIYINATIGWVLRAWTELAAPITAIVPD